MNKVKYCSLTNNDLNDLDGVGKSYDTCMSLKKKDV